MAEVVNVYAVTLERDIFLSAALSATITHLAARNALRKSTDASRAMLIVSFSVASLRAESHV